MKPKKIQEKSALLIQQIANLKKKLEGGGDTPETLEAVTGPNNQVSATKESAADIQQQINALQGQRAKLVARNETLKKEIAALKSEREPLVVRRNELQEITFLASKMKSHNS
jgi:uncharacterized coiled-coil DUF342 family protein